MRGACIAFPQARRRGERRINQEGHDLSIATHAGAPANETAAPVSARIADSGILPIITAALDDMKAEDVTVIDLKGRSEIADHMVVASGRSSRQVGAIADKVMEELKARAGVIARTEGKDQGDWVLIDAGDAVVHVFRPEVREFYQLEKMWMAPETA